MLDNPILPEGGMLDTPILCMTYYNRCLLWGEECVYSHVFRLEISVTKKDLRRNVPSQSTLMDQLLPGNT